ncbi:hypothetical protein DLJ58_11410 [Micromonospora arida]|uniref:Uncharacterized protein n=1 Tax=Micromonospora arida TaxID=2203715 RepID=A0A3N9XBT6_9ACTN|nr:hypothetical protein DLJ58_11410 [Micromonospora arida]
MPNTLSQTGLVIFRRLKGRVSAHIGSKDSQCHRKASSSRTCRPPPPRRWTARWYAVTIWSPTGSTGTLAKYPSIQTVLYPEAGGLSVLPLTGRSCVLRPLSVRSVAGRDRHRLEGTRSRVGSKPATGRTTSVVVRADAVTGQPQP